MEKTIADKLIQEYMQKIYGFALSKAFNLNEAEELCSDIVYEVYTSLLKLPYLQNSAGYIWRISENVYARSVASKKRDAHTPLDDVILPVYDEYETDDEVAETYRRLRREIAYLTKTRREIIMLFYFGKMKITEIADRTHLPEGTVKWHLSAARDELKEGMKMERAIGKLGLSPVRFAGFGHNGRPGNLGGPEAYISGLIEQNILYSVYTEPKSAAEIADELGISPVYLADIIDKLEENGFLVKTDKAKYTTYVMIAPTTYSLKDWEADYQMKVEITELLKKEYVPQVKAFAEALEEVYLPNGNRDLLFATLLPYCILEQNQPYGEAVDISKYFIKTTDGGYYIAHAYQNQTQSDLDYTPTLPIRQYDACGPMDRISDKYPGIGSWAINSKFDSRKGYWQNNLTEDYDYLYEFICGKLPKGQENIEKYQRLYERHFLDEQDRVQVIILKKEALDALPAFSPELREKLSAYAGRGYELLKKAFPPQMHDLIRDQSRSVLDSRICLMILDDLLTEGALPPFTEAERTTLNLIMFSDKLPE